LRRPVEDPGIGSFVYKRAMSLRSGRAWVFGALLCAALWLALSRPVRANDFEAFESARNAYEAQDYAQAVKRFEALGGGDSPVITNRSLLLESKKYLGASYLFLGKLPLAEAEFERLLRMDPQYILDPLAFPGEVQRLFAGVKARLDAERRVADEERKREQDRLQKLESERVTGQRSRWERLTQLAETERVQEVRSRWVALMPFGIGQLQNGHADLGAVLAVSEGSLLLVSFVSWIVHENLRGQQPGPNERDQFNLTERVSRYTNQISLGLFGAVALTGIIDAQLRFQGDVWSERKRELPKDLQQAPSVSLGPRGLSVHLKF
jgi:tetratricopeptide (TPR) repeat protein